MRGIFLTGSFLLLAVLLCGGCKDGGRSSKTPQEQVTIALKIEDPVDRFKKLVDISEEFRKLSDSTGAKECLRHATEAADAIDIDRLAAERTRAHIDLAGAQNDNGDRRGCKDAYERAEVALKQVEDVASKTEYLVDLALLKIKIGEESDAGRDLKDAETASEEINDSQFRVEMLGWMTIAYKRLENAEEAERMMQLAKAVADSQEKTSEKARRLSQVAREQIKSLDDKEAGMKTFLEAVEVGRSVDDSDYQRASTLVAIAKDYVEVKQIDKAQELLDEAQKIALGKSALGPVLKEIDEVRRSYN